MYKGKGSGYKGRGSGYKGRGSRYKRRGSGYKGRGSGYKGRGSGYRGRGVGVRGGGIQHQEYIMTFNEVLNTIGTHTVLSCFISFHQRTRFIKELDSDLLFWPILLFFITCVYVVVHLGDYQA